MPGTKLAEQKLADHFGVSRTLVRQALFQLSQNRLIRLEPARGAFVATPSVDEARQVFAVRRMLEAEMVRSFVKQSSAAKIRALKQHVAAEKKAMEANDVGQRTELLGRLPCAHGRAHGQRGAGSVAGRADFPLRIDHPDVPVCIGGRAFARRTC
ncbi:transcriptional regulator, GntR family [Comamonas thiooxydans]|nr:transcriptional regulator, GntR family [Comamonas thiooxydans]